MTILIIFFVQGLGGGGKDQAKGIIKSSRWIKLKKLMLRKGGKKKGETEGEMRILSDSMQR